MVRTVLVLSMLAGVASADPAAEALFREGRELAKAGKLDDACDRFARSEAIEPKVGTALNLGDCREHQHLLADAWEAFVAAQSLASRDRDDRGVEAARRAAALEPKLAHLRITARARPPGLAIARDGKPLAIAVLDTEIPVDPGSYVISATAPGYKPTTVRVQLALGAHETAVLPALEIDPDAPQPLPPIDRVRPPLGHFSIGAAFGGTSDSDIVGGVRFVGSYEVPHGALRATFQGLYTRYHLNNDMGMTDPYHYVDLYGLTLGADYLWAWFPGLASAAGLGVGLDIVDDNYESLAYNTWASVRVSPLIVRLATPKLELGLHFLYVFQAKVVVGVVGADWFVW